MKTGWAREKLGERSCLIFLRLGWVECSPQPGIVQLTTGPDPLGKAPESPQHTSSAGGRGRTARRRERTDGSPAPTPWGCPRQCWPHPVLPGARLGSWGPRASRGAATSRRVCPQAEWRAGEEPRPLQPRRARPEPWPSPHSAPFLTAPSLTCLPSCRGSEALH